MSTPFANQEPQTLTILHLSDLHLGPESATGSEIKVDVEHLEQRTLAQDVLTWLRDWPRTPDYIVVSGDLTNQGQQVGYDELRRGYDALAKAGRAPRPDRIIVVPGNHDVAWAKTWQQSENERWSRFADAVAPNFVRPWLPTVDPPQSELLALMKANIAVDEDVVGGALRIGDDDRTFEHRQFLPFVFHRSHKVVFYAFNSASLSGTLLALDTTLQRDIDWLQGDASPNSERAGRVVDALLARSQIDAARLQSSELTLFQRTMAFLQELLPEEFADALKIAVVHHHVAPMPQEEVKQFESLLNAGEFKADLIANGFQIVLHGHKHAPRVFLDSTVTDSPLVVIAGATIGGNVPRGHHAGFHWIEVPPDRASVSVRTLAVPDSGGFPKAWDRAVAITVPLIPTSVSLMQSLVPVLRERFSVRDFKRDARNALIGSVIDDRASGGALVGWSHDLTQTENVTMIATAIGLRLMRQLDADFRQFRGEEVVTTLLELRQRADGLWSGTAEGSMGRPEASAYAILALHSWSFHREVDEALDGFEGAFSQDNDPVLWKHVTSLSLATQMLARVSPASPLLSQMVARILTGMRRVEGDGAYWTQRLDRDDQEASAAHTALALIALTEASEATPEIPGIGGAITAGASWLLEQAEWPLTAERISRPVGPSKVDGLNWRHLTNARALSALVRSGVDARGSEVARRELETLIAECSSGLCAWSGGRQRPIWATADALDALTHLAMEALVT